MKSLLACAAFAVSATAAAGDPLSAKAAAILQQRCLACHSEKAAMSDLRLTGREDALRGGKRGPALQPGHASESLLFQAVAHVGKITMPPGAKIPDEEIETLRAWIDKGAEWPQQSLALKGADWWAFHRPRRPTVLAVPGAKTAIDSFVQAKLQAAGIDPAPEADRFTLLRRACFDLHGLPPTPKQAAEFLEDKSPNAWERLIDSLLASPRYGEKWGRHWLDLVRYGDTSGFEQDPYSLGSWRYRDWVIRSLNADKPYDRFVKEQIAGDELWPDDADARSGTGYFRVGPNRDMLFKVDDINRIEKLTDYVDTTSGVFLGLTVGCARCHDHKFDPIPQRDYYRMQAIFAPLVYDQVPLDYNPSRVEALAENTRTFKLWQIGETIERLYRPYRERIRESRMAPLSEEAKQALRVPEDKRT